MFFRKKPKITIKHYLVTSSCCKTIGRYQGKIYIEEATVWDFLYDMGLLEAVVAMQKKKDIASYEKKIDDVKNA